MLWIRVFRWLLVRFYYKMQQLAEPLSLVSHSPQELWASSTAESSLINHARALRTAAALSARFPLWPSLLLLIYVYAGVFQTQTLPRLILIASSRYGALWLGVLNVRCGAASHADNKPARDTSFAPWASCLETLRANTLRICASPLLIAKHNRRGPRETARAAENVAGAQSANWMH